MSLCAIIKTINLIITIKISKINCNFQSEYLTVLWVEGLQGMRKNLCVRIGTRMKYYNPGTDLSVINQCRVSYMMFQSVADELLLINVIIINLDQVQEWLGVDPDPDLDR